MNSYPELWQRSREGKGATKQIATGAKAHTQASANLPGDLTNIPCKTVALGWF